MSVSHFLVQLGLYDDAFTDMDEYAQLPMDYPRSLTLHSAYKPLCGLGQYELGVPKAICLSWPSYKYIHAILNRSMNGHGDSTGGLSR